MSKKLKGKLEITYDWFREDQRPGQTCGTVYSVNGGFEPPYALCPGILKAITRY